jgi:hypothetical protein
VEFIPGNEFGIVVMLRLNQVNGNEVVLIG